MDNINVSLVIDLYKKPLKTKALSLSQWQKIILVLRHHQLLARYYQRFVQTGVFDFLPEYCRHHFINGDVIAQNQKIQVEFEAKELVDALKGRVEYLIFLKGAGYSLSDHPVGNGRVYSDIDVLVDKPSIVNVERQLLHHGWMPESVSDYDDKYYRKWAHEIPPMRQSKRGTIIDIHHNIVPPISGRAPNVSALIEEVIHTNDGYAILTPAAMTLHSIVHLFFNEDMKNGYRDLIDIHMFMSKDADKNYWQTLLKLAQDTGFEYELFLACRYVTRIFDTEVPDYITVALAKCEPRNIKLLDFMFTKVLTPVHPYASPSFFLMAEFFILVRGHFLKMPAHILIYHLISKGCISITCALLGKHFFEKELKQP